MGGVSLERVVRVDPCDAVDGDRCSRDLGGP